MNATTVSYGAPELKRLGSRYLAEGFLLSLSIHIFAVAGLIFLRPPAVGTLTTGGGHLRNPWDPIREVHINGADPIKSGMPSGPHNPGKYAIPVPVPNAAEDTTLNRKDDPQPSGGPAGEGPERGEIIDGGGIAVGDGTIDEPVPIELTEELPKIILAKAPEYPQNAIRSNLTGRVVVKMLVDKWGRVKDAAVQSSSEELFNDCTLEAARQYIFRPAVMNKRPVSVWVSVPFVFRLGDKK